MLIVRGVNVFPSEIERVLLAEPELAPHYRIVLDRQHALDTLTVEAELTEGAPVDAAATNALRDRVWRQLDAALGISAHVTLCPPGMLPRSEGKAQRVVDRRIL
jgi:phenylacetate-CoA ligase